ncbi:hypothetical protein Pfo_019104 [Paulownia fortunei]|nr:hypothetical protein Pfo_019104 [Paulownia fortunei]
MVFSNVYALKKALRKHMIRLEFEIKKDKKEKGRRAYVNDHNCVRVDIQREAYSTWMVGKLTKVHKENPSMKLKGLRSKLRRYRVCPQYMKFRIKSIKKIPVYAEMVIRSNPGSIIRLQYQRVTECDKGEDGGVGSSRESFTPTFKRVSMGLKSMKESFLNGCSPFIRFDRCHLKGPWEGVLLAAMGLDGNNMLYPIVLVVVGSEYIDCWGFYFQCLDGMLGGFNTDKPWTFMTNRQKLIPVNIWARYNFGIKLKNNYVTNNISKFFNCWIGELRPKSILTLLDGLRTKLMSRKRLRYERGLRWTNVVYDNVVTKFNGVKEDSIGCHLMISSAHEFQVKDRGMRYIEISRIPYKHVALGITHRRESLEFYINVIHPVHDPVFWPTNLDPDPATLFPPKIKKTTDRPKKNTIKRKKKATVEGTANTPPAIQED